MKLYLGGALHSLRGFRAAFSCLIFVR